MLKYAGLNKIIILTICCLFVIHVVGNIFDITFSLVKRLNLCLNNLILKKNHVYNK